jgi:hypothetical protein
VGTCVQIMTSSRAISFRQVRDVPNEHDFVDLLRYVGIFRLQMRCHLTIWKRIDDVFVIVIAFVLVRNLPNVSSCTTCHRWLKMIRDRMEWDLNSLFLFCGFSSMERPVFTPWQLGNSHFKIFSAFMECFSICSHVRTCTYHIIHLKRIRRDVYLEKVNLIRDLKISETLSESDDMTIQLDPQFPFQFPLRRVPRSTVCLVNSAFSSTRLPVTSRHATWSRNAWVGAWLRLTLQQPSRWQD